MSVHTDGSAESRDLGRRQARTSGVFAAAGAAVTAVPAAPGLVLATAGHPQAAVPLLLTATLAGIISVITGAAVRIYESRQGTRQVEIRHEPLKRLVDAMAGCIDAASAADCDLPARQRAADAVTVRASAVQAVTQMLPALLSAPAQQPPADPSTP